MKKGVLDGIHMMGRIENNYEFQITDYENERE